MRQAREICKAAFQVEASASVPEDHFRGVASVFGNLIDAHVPTVIHPGAFKKTLDENAGRVRILWQHRDDEPIGRPVEMRETPLGLEVVGRISNTARGKDALTLMRDGVITDLSIGFDPITHSMEDDDTHGRVRHIRELRLWEFSPVTWGANEPAKVQEINAAATPLAERLRRHVEAAELEEAVRLLCGPVSQLKDGQLSPETAELAKAAAERLSALLETAAPPLEDEVARTVARQSARLAVLRLAEVEFNREG